MHHVFASHPDTIWVLEVGNNPTFSIGEKFSALSLEKNGEYVRRHFKVLDIHTKYESHDSLRTVIIDEVAGRDKASTTTKVMDNIWSPKELEDQQLVDAYRQQIKLIVPDDSNSNTTAFAAHLVEHVQQWEQATSLNVGANRLSATVYDLLVKSNQSLEMAIDCLTVSMRSINKEPELLQVVKHLEYVDGYEVGKDEIYKPQHISSLEGVIMFKRLLYFLLIRYVFGKDFAPLAPAASTKVFEQPNMTNSEIAPVIRKVAETIFSNPDYEPRTKADLYSRLVELGVYKLLNTAAYINTQYEDYMEESDRQMSRLLVTFESLLRLDREASSMINDKWELPEVDVVVPLYTLIK